MEIMRKPFSPEALEGFFETVGILLKGMIGIFVFMLLFYLLIKLLTRIYKDKSEEPQDHTPQTTDH
jgi:hypothetical protein